MRSACIALATSLLWSVPGLATAQASGAAWTVSGGGGLALDLGGHDASRQGEGAPLGRVAVERRSGAWGVGLAWRAAYIGGRYSGDRRHDLAVQGLYRGGPMGLGVHAGVGLGIATVVDEDFPPADGPPGDGLVSIGDTGAVGLSFGVDRPVGIGPRAFVAPSVELMLQRAGGRSLATLGFGVALGWRLR